MARLNPLITLPFEVKRGITDPNFIRAALGFDFDVGAGGRGLQQQVDFGLVFVNQLLSQKSVIFDFGIGAEHRVYQQRYAIHFNGHFVAIQIIIWLNVKLYAHFVPNSSEAGFKSQFGRQHIFSTNQRRCEHQQG